MHIPHLVIHNKKALQTCSSYVQKSSVLLLFHTFKCLYHILTFSAANGPFFRLIHVNKSVLFRCKVASNAAGYCISRLCSSYSSSSNITNVICRYTLISRSEEHTYEL